MIKKNSFFYPFTALVLASNLFVGCQIENIPVASNVNNDNASPPTIIPIVTVPTKEIKKEIDVSEAFKVPINAKVEVIQTTKKKIPTNKRLIKLSIYVPRNPLRDLKPEGLVIQALPVNSIVKLKAQVTGIGISTPILPDETTDPNIISGYVPVSTTGMATVNFVVPVGVNRIVTLTGYTDTEFTVPGSVIKGVLNVTDTGVNAVDIAWRSTPTATTIEKLITLNPLLASLIDYNQLQSYIDNNLTMPNSSGATFGTHPSLINSETLAVAINNLNAISPPDATPILPVGTTPDMFITPVTLQGQVFIVYTGYNNADFTINCFDPSSAYPGFSYNSTFTAPATINYSISGILPLANGSWTVKLKGVFSGTKHSSTAITRYFDTSTTASLNFSIY